MPYITAEPDAVRVVRQRPLRALILASDGLWAMEENAKTVARIVRDALDQGDNPAHKLVDHVIDDCVLPRYKAIFGSRDELLSLPLGKGDETILGRRELFDDITVLVIAVGAGAEEEEEKKKRKMEEEEEAIGNDDTKQKKKQKTQCA